MQIKIKETEKNIYTVIDGEGINLTTPSNRRDAVKSAVSALQESDSMVLEEMDGFTHNVVIVDEKPSCTLIRIGVGLNTTFIIL